MSPSDSSILAVLPPREVFSPEAAGAIAMVAWRLAAATPGMTVAGSPCAAPFPGIMFCPVTGTVSLLSLIRRLRPSVIEVHQQPRLAVTLSIVFPRIKIMLFLHNEPLTMRGLKSAAGRRFALSRLHRVICVSNYLAQRYMTGLVPPAVIAGAGAACPPAILPNPLTLSELPPRAKSRRQTILFAGRVVADKAPDIFIAACAAALPALPGWSATMIGGDRFGPDSPETSYVAGIRAAAQAAGIGFAGARPHAEVLQAMSQAAIIAVPSRWPEPFGLTALEAIASGAALIAANTGGLSEVAGDAALYVPPDDAPALAEAIIALAQNPARRTSLAAAGLARAQNFDTPTIAAALAKLR